MAKRTEQRRGSLRPNSVSLTVSGILYLGHRCAAAAERASSSEKRAAGGQRQSLLLTALTSLSQICSSGAQNLHRAR